MLVQFFSREGRERAPEARLLEVGGAEELHNPV